MLRVVQLLYLMLPVYAANMAPPFVKFWPGWNKPLDERRLGAHKTVMGVVFGLIAALATAWAQWQVGWQDALVDYRQWPLLGLACGTGALAGDALKSFVKRRIGIAPGARWIPADQLDFVVGGLVALAPFAPLTLADCAIVLVVSFVGDIAVNQVSFRLGVRDTKW